MFGTAAIQNIIKFTCTNESYQSLYKVKLHPTQKRYPQPTPLLSSFGLSKEKKINKQNISIKHQKILKTLPKLRKNLT